MIRFIMVLLASAYALFLTGCGDSGGLPSQPDTCNQVVSIQVAPQKALLKGVSTDQLPVGVNAQYEATLTYCDGSTRVTTDGVYWSVSNTNANISENGMVTTITAGADEIFAKFENLVGERTLTISDATLIGLNVTPPNATIPKGLTQSYLAQGTYSDGTSLDVTGIVQWSSSNPSIASINAGIATGLGEGTTNITATLNGKSANATLDVTAALLTGLSVTPPNATIPKGLTQNYLAQGTYSDGSIQNVTGLASWNSSNPGIASINKGVVTGVSEGATNITATLNGKSANATLDVTAAVLTGLSVTPPNATIPKGLTQSYLAQGTYSDGTSLDVTGIVQWSSSNPSIASINAGIATGLGEGTTNITATLNGKSANATLDVTAALLTGLSVTPPNATIPKGLTQSYLAQGTYSDGSIQDVTGLVAWSSSNQSVANIAPNGDAVGINKGTSAITAVLDGLSANASLTVTLEGTVITWGVASSGGDSSAVQDQLTGVKAIYANNSGQFSAFAALRYDGTVVTWGTATTGGDSSAVQAQLNNVKTIYSTNVSFAALKNDGTVITWGNLSNGGDSSAVAAQLTNVIEISATSGSFAALKQDGTVVTWGDPIFGGNSSLVQAQLSNVQKIYASPSVFAALKQDGTVVTWGNSISGGNSSAVQAQLTNVQAVVHTISAFAALKQDGTVVAWGDPSYGGDSSAVQAQLTSVQSIVGTGSAFAALKQDGSVVTWGNSSTGGDSSTVQPQLTNVQSIFANPFAFAALKQDGSVVTWGSGLNGGDSSAVQAQLASVNTIVHTLRAFAALKQDGTVVTWGDPLFGGDSSAVQAQLTNVQTIFATEQAFAALKQDGTVVTWGDSSNGGDSSTVQIQLTNVQTVFSHSSAFAALIGL
jgi:hypothetical protein